jgi:uncharacterized cysteine cluster protein YcgN (CxxCxxCC family)
MNAKDMPANKKPWWEQKTLHEMTREEWEQLCDHCGKCCLHKLEDEDTQIVYYTNVACYLMDGNDGHCTDYANRCVKVPTCVQLDISNLDSINWMPPSCSYRLLKEGKALPRWHHLITGNKQSIHKAGQSVIGRFIPETEINEEDIEDYIVEWPIESID